MTDVLAVLFLLGVCFVAGAGGGVALFLCARREFQSRLDRCKMEYKP